MIIENGMYLTWSVFRNLAALVGSKQAKRSDPSCIKQDNFIAKSFGLSTKRNLGSLELSLSICVFFDWRIFNLEMQNFSLENHHIMNARQPFCWWMTFTKVSNPFLPSPPKWLTWPLDVCGGVGYGWLYWFGLYGRTFSQTSLELEILSSTSNDVTIFFRIIRHERYFFQCRIFFFQEFICMLFSSRNQSAGYFLKSSITPSKVKWSASKIQQTFGQLTDSNLSIISKGFWNNGGQNSLGERGGIRFHSPTPAHPNENNFLSTS